MKKIKKRMWAGASSSILASMLILSSGHVYADTGNEAIATPRTFVSRNPSGMHMMHRFNSVTKINSLATKLGLDPEDVKTELQGGKNLKQLLLDHGITGTEIEKAFTLEKTKEKTKDKKGINGRNS